MQKTAFFEIFFRSAYRSTPKDFKKLCYIVISILANMVHIYLQRRIIIYKNFVKGFYKISNCSIISCISILLLQGVNEMSEETKKTKVRLKICGSQFVITADESEQYIQKIAKIVDERIKYLDDSDPKLSLHMATIVAALNYCDQLEKEKVITRELIKKADDCEAIAKDATFRLNKLIIENAQLREEKAGLHKVIAELKEGAYTESTSAPAISKENTVANTKVKPSKLNSINISKADETVTDEDFLNMLDGENN